MRFWFPTLVAIAVLPAGAHHRTAPGAGMSGCLPAQSHLTSSGH